ncbi:Crp/Fnr family transcriptional regulator [Paracraurococcus lichenis]|uniref:Helix-turn-helix domain-containing protein n=1 Tax=Paracraurococcus lichenis TaxID=3064888 RepID=A0ABT9E640_9PROT|nr:helix-turn-helix domain-containing protein [Paracraurococcus sp. LOR1-02]MDO9711530.1 helix-turn-helix domain-containing protein [Paracraurococcus sp. LOR1-02]
MTLTLGEVLFEPGIVPGHVYFPHAGTMIALALPLAEGGSAEMATIGDEGAAGLGLDAADPEPDPLTRGIVRIPGPADRIATARLADAAAGSPLLRRLLARHAEASVAMALHAAACHGRHPLPARLATWLLTALDRAPRGEPAIPLTQEFLAERLGIHRATLSPALLSLRRDRMLRVRRGRVLVLDRAALEHAACGCRAAVRRRFARLSEHIGPGTAP